MDTRLVTFKPDGEEIDIRLVKPVTVIGRGDDCELELPLPGVSRRHCEIRLNKSIIKAKDLGSSNGTYVNGRRIDESSLSVGDKLKVGSVTFAVRINGVPERIVPAKAHVRKRASRRPASPGGNKRGRGGTGDTRDAAALSSLARRADEHDPETEAIAALNNLDGSKIKKTQSKESKGSKGRS